MRGVNSLLGEMNWSVPAVLALALVGCSAETNDPTTPGMKPNVTNLPTAGMGSLPNNVPNVNGMAGTSAPAATAGTGSIDTPPNMATGTPLPCAVQAALKTNCQGCHGSVLVGGAPLKLLTHEDFMKDYTALTTKSVKGMTMKAHQLARLRLNSAAEPMPPGGQIAAGDKAMLDGWLAAGAAPGTEADRTCASNNMGTGGTGVPMGGSGGNHDGWESLCDASSAYQKVMQRDGETCYAFRTHGGQTLDDSPYMIAPGENYEQFYFTVPWDTGVQGTRFGANFDNLQVLHHWLLFTTGNPVRDGQHETVIGTQLGDTNSKLLGGWAVGGCNVEFPSHMGLQLPPKGSMLNVQWHFYNNTTTPQPDKSEVVVCTVPAGTRPNTGSLTWLGTENFNGPFGMGPGMNDFGDTCPNDSNGPITIWGFWPHMHELGRHMKSVVHRVSGMDEMVFDKPFDFNKQIHYENKPELVLMPGDKITSTCTFVNDTGANVAFGPSTKQEMCYQFAFSYPAGALDNAAPSLIGAQNTCWGAL